MTTRTQRQRLARPWAASRKDARTRLLAAAFGRLRSGTRDPSSKPTLSRSDILELLALAQWPTTRRLEVTIALGLSDSVEE